jgi:hypothetical protein
LQFFFSRPQGPTYQPPVRESRSGAPLTITGTHLSSQADSSQISSNPCIYLRDGQVEYSKKKMPVVFFNGQPSVKRTFEFEQWVGIAAPIHIFPRNATRQPGQISNLNSFHHHGNCTPHYTSCCCSCLDTPPGVNATQSWICCTCPDSS